MADEPPSTVPLPPDEGARAAMRPGLTVEGLESNSDASAPVDAETPPLDATVDHVSNAGSQVDVYLSSRVGKSKRKFGKPPEKVGGYKIGELLGSGSMGEVYEAQDESGRKVAIKLIHAKLAGGGRAAERFRREGQLASQINHPRTVFVVAADERDGMPFIVMERMPGGTLKDIVERKGPLPPLEAVRKVLDVVDGLIEAHKLGVLHRDVKPANCYLDERGGVKVGDFGLARSLGPDLSLTFSGTFVGTPLFSAPEQLKGESLDVRGDIYSVAATLYYLLCGKAMFEDSEGTAAIARAVTEDAPPLSSLCPEINPKLERIVMRALERDRVRRYPSMAEFRTALESVLPPKMSVATLGKRLLSFVVDIGIIDTFLLLLAIIPSLRSSAQLDVADGLTVSTYLLYFWLFEWLLGATPGKLLCRLRVVSAKSPDRPSAWRVLLRAASFVGVLQLLTLLPPWEKLAAKLFNSTDAGEIVGPMFAASLWLLPLISMRARNGYRGLHEFVSGTVTAQLARPKQAGDLVHRLAKFECVEPLLEELPAELPARIASFKLRGVLSRNEGGMLLVADDAALGREVWIHLRPASAGALSAARCNAVRSTRLRWIATGTQDNCTWDAFVAPDAVPLVVVTSKRQPLGWSDTRHLLDELTKELETAYAEEALPKDLAIDGVWIRYTGGALLLDSFPPIDRGPLSCERDPQEPLQLLAGIAITALEGEYRTPQPIPPPAPTKGLRKWLRRAPAPALRAPLPASAQDALATLFDPAIEQKDGLAAFRGKLDATSDEATEATRVGRLAQAVVFAEFVAIPVLLVYLAIHMLGFGEALSKKSTERSYRAAAQIIKNPEMSQALQKKTGKPPMSPEEKQVAVERLRARGRQLHESADEDLKNLGLLRFVVEILPVGSLFEDFDKPLEIRTSDGENGTPLYHLDSGSAMGTEDSFSAKQISTWIDPAAPPFKPVWRSDFLHFAAFLTIPGAANALGTFLAGTILSFRLAGMRLVRRDGRPAGRLRLLWRTLIVWIFPTALFVLLAWCMYWSESKSIAALAPLIRGLLAATAIAYFWLAIRFPRRGPHDVLAGTYVVPV